MSGREPMPKPDGWHTYHVCGGILRELVWSGIDAHCVVCGWWCRVLTTPPTESLATPVPADDRS